jgi:hypothetical protein
MKRWIIPLLLVTSIAAQTNYTLVGGINIATIEYNDDEVGDLVDISSKYGFILGVETMTGPVLLGIAAVQRGAQAEMDFMGQTISGYDIYNYISVYGAYPFTLQEGFTFMAGLQVGQPLGGNSEMNNESEEIDADLLALDYGLLLGANILLDPQIGFRATYYLGLADVSKDFPSNLNWKNRGIGITLLYTL